MKNYINALKLKSTRRKLGKRFHSITINNVPCKDFTIAQLGFKYVEYFMDEEDTALQLTEDVYVIIAWEENERIKIVRACIPKGYMWDGASIPSSVQGILGGKLNPSFIIASLLHDYMIEQKLLPHYAESRMFYEVLKTRKGNLDIPWWKEVPMFLAVYLWSIAT